MILIALAYVGGLLTLLSPCILPVLPFVFARADRPFLRHGLPMLAGMAAAFAVVASLAAVGGGWVVAASNAGRVAALVLMGLFGLALLAPAIGERMSRPFVALGERLSAGAAGRSSVFASALLGVGTGLLWTPCAGPVLGLILTGAAVGGASVGTSLLLLAYAAGASTSLALALLCGRRILRLLAGTLGAGERLRRIAGAAVLAGVAAIALGLDTGAASRVSWPATAALEDALLRGADLRDIAPAIRPEAPAAGPMPAVWREVAVRLASEGTLPPLDGATEWINSAPLTAAGLRGKVVLVDFWTYSCINCLRTLPYVRAWADKYKADGLVVIGVHTPEFAFEKDSANVHRALRDLHVDYPVAVDSRYAIWRAFGNSYWPAMYFVDAQGRVRHHQFGEGSYAQSEDVIRQLLVEAGHPPAAAAGAVPGGQGTQAAAGPGLPSSDETYLGYGHDSDVASPDRIVADQPRSYRAASALRLNQWTLAGDWVVGREAIALQKPGGTIAFRFKARDLHLVLGPASDGQPVPFRVRIDGRPPLDDHGADIDAQGAGSVDTHRLYQLVRQAGGDRERLFEIEFARPGVEAFAFTFG